jgi:hypothetical protein
LVAYSGLCKNSIRKLSIYDYLLLNIIMCMYTVVVCHVHRDIIARRTTLCNAGIRGSICMNKNTVARPTINNRICSISSGLIIDSPSQFAFVAECVLPTRKCEIDCAFIDKSRFSDTDVDPILTAYNNARSNANRKMMMHEEIVTISDQEESSDSDESVDPDESVSQVSNRNRSQNVYEQRIYGRTTTPSRTRNAYGLDNISEVDNRDVETYVSTNVNRNTARHRNPDTTMVRTSKLKTNSQAGSNVSTGSGRMIRITRGSKAGSYVRVD